MTGPGLFAERSILSIEENPRVAELTLQIAKCGASINQNRIELAAEPMYQACLSPAHPITALQGCSLLWDKVRVNGVSHDQRFLDDRR